VEALRSAVGKRRSREWLRPRVPPIAKPPLVEGGPDSGAAGGEAVGCGSRGAAVEEEGEADEVAMAAEKGTKGGRKGSADEVAPDDSFPATAAAKALLLGGPTEVRRGSVAIIDGIHWLSVVRALEDAATEPAAAGAGEAVEPPCLGSLKPLPRPGVLATLMGVPKAPLPAAGDIAEVALESGLPDGTARAPPSPDGHAPPPLGTGAT